MYMTPEEIAKDLRVDVSTVRGWIRSGDLPATRAGRQYRVKYEDYEAFLKSREVKNQPKMRMGSTLLAQ